jgi:hypothetical protein
MQYAEIITHRRFRHPGKCLIAVVRVLELRRNTAHIEATRMNGQVVRKYVKRSRLRFL